MPNAFMPRHEFLECKKVQRLVREYTELIATSNEAPDMKDQHA